MPAPDNLQIVISEAELQKINEAVATLNTLLKPLLISLTSQEIRRLPKPGDASLPFMQKALDLAEQQPQFAPGYLDVPGLRQDLTAWQHLITVRRQLEPLMADLNSTTIKLSSEAYVTSLAYYSSVQEANKRGVSGAQSVYTTLKTRFEQPDTPTLEAASRR